MKIEKLIDLDHVYERVEEITCHEKINTTALSNGLECDGFIEITGVGFMDGQQIPIHELIDLSIFAPFYKISDTEQFGIHLSEYNIHLDQSKMKCEFQFEVSGLIEETEKDNQIDELINDDENACIEDLLDDSESVLCKVKYACTYPSDNYGSLALRYGVEENLLRSINQNKTLSGRMLILLPSS